MKLMDKLTTGSTVKKSALLGALLVALSAVPSLSYAKGAPLFFQTGDELFEIEDAPLYEDGYSLGYACQRFGLFGADVWTWDCDLMAINIDEFAAGDISEEDKLIYASTYSLSDRKRDVWNQYGIFALAFGLGGLGLFKSRS